METITATQPGFFDVEERLQRLSDIGDQLEAYVAVVDFEIFQADLEAALGYSDGAKGGQPQYIRIHSASACPNAAPLPTAGRAPRLVGLLNDEAPYPGNSSSINPAERHPQTEMSGAIRCRATTRALPQSASNLCIR